MMVFLSICTALYDYIPQDDSELAIKQGELIYILEKSAGDDWWKAKKRAPGEAEEPVGLIPYNYVEEVSRHSFRVPTRWGGAKEAGRCNSASE